MIKGIVLKQQKGLYTVEAEDGTKLLGYAGSKLRKNGVKLLAGDIILYTINPDGTIFITDIEPRKNDFIRPPVANVDTIVLVVATAEPEPDYYNIDSVLAMADAAQAKSVIVFNKTDIADAESFLQVYTSSNYKVVALSALDNSLVCSDLYNCLEGVCVFTGQSGVGKSTLINKLFPELEVETGELSERIRRGKNTTRHTELFPLGNGLYLADTPGFSSIDFLSFDILKLADFEENCFPELLEFKDKCKFRGCSHLKEDGCAVISAVQDGLVQKTRYESYSKLKRVLLQKEANKYAR